MIGRFFELIYFLVKWSVIILGGTYVLAVAITWVFLLGGVPEILLNPIAVFGEVHPLAKIFTTWWCPEPAICFIGLKAYGFELFRVEVFP